MDASAPASSIVVVAGMDAVRTQAALGQDTGRGHQVETLNSVAELVRRCGLPPLPDCLLLSH